MNVKGQRMNKNAFPEMTTASMERHLYGVDKGPKMLPRKQRLAVWRGMFFIGLWFYGCYSLISYRLKSDDLELMEREVYEDLNKKKEVERLMSRKDLG